MRYCTFIFSISCSIASVTSYFIKKRLNIYKMATSILLKFLTLEWNISRTIWRIEVGDGWLFCIFHALSFELNFFFDRRFPLRLQLHGAIYRPDSFVLMLRCCSNLKAIRYESMSLNRIVADKSHRVVIA